MPKRPCPICGDPNAFPIWIDDVPPEGCPHDDAWLMHGKPPTIRNVTECAHQMAMARQSAELRRLAPQCFDVNGKMMPGRSAEAWGAYVRAHPSTPVKL